MAGLAAGITLGASGHDVLIVEHAAQLRTGGSPIDIRGDAIAIVDKLGLLQQIDDHTVSMTELAQFVDRDGQIIADLPGDEVGDSDGDLEIPRDDLARVFLEALNPATSPVFGESIRTLHQDADGVDVAFVSGKTDRFDLVVGADGMHSLTRRLAFGPEQDYIHHLGIYVALTNLPGRGGSGRSTPMLNWPGHSIGIARYNDVALGVLNFRSPWIDYDYHDLDAQRQIVLDAFAGHDEWLVPEILDAVRTDPELYFDSVGQIKMETWHDNRVVLVGDAAHSASPHSGRGTSLAISGAWFLAEGLDEHPTDLAAAFGDYEANQRPYVTRAQATAAPGGDLLVPATQEALDARNERLRSMTADQ